MKRTESFYHNKRWTKLRVSILTRDCYTCQDSKRYGRRVQADVVHHIFPRDLFPEYEWEPWNLISLCSKAHEEMHDRVTGQLTDKGLDLLRRTALKRGMDLKEIDSRMVHAASQQ